MAGELGCAVPASPDGGHHEDTVLEVGDGSVQHGLVLLPPFLSTEGEVLTGQVNGVWKEAAEDEGAREEDGKEGEIVKDVQLTVAVVVGHFVHDFLHGVPDIGTGFWQDGLRHHTHHVVHEGAEKWHGGSVGTEGEERHFVGGVLVCDGVAFGARLSVQKMRVDKLIFVVVDVMHA